MAEQTEWTDAQWDAAMTELVEFFTTPPPTKRVRFSGNSVEELSSFMTTVYPGDEVVIPSSTDFLTVQDHLALQAMAIGREITVRFEK